MDQNSKRILIVDDNESIHEDIHNTLKSPTEKGKDSKTAELERELFGEEAGPAVADERDKTDYQIDDAYQGAEAIKMVDRAAEEGFPYALIFMDVRMPPGMDGIQAITKIWEKHPQTEMVICTAYSDYSWDQIVDQFGTVDHLFFMKKPFDSIVLKQTALSLTSKWETANRSARYVEKLEGEIQQRTQQLNEMVDHLKKLKKDSEFPTLAKNNFFTTITAELQTPLNGIQGITDLLLDTDLNEEQRNFAETIKHSSNSLMLVVNDILDFSKSELADLEDEKIVFDLRTTLEAVIELVEVAAIEKEVEIAYFVDCRVSELFVGDPFNLRQILLIALTQFIKAVDSCEIIVSVSYGKLEDPGEIQLQFEISKMETINDDFLEKKRIFQGFQSGMLSSMDKGIKFPRQDQLENLVAKIKGEFETVKFPQTGAVLRFTGRFAISSPSFPNLELSSTIIGIRCLIVSDNSISRKVLSLHIDHWGGICKAASHRDNITEEIKLSSESNLPYDAVIVDLKTEQQEFYQTIARDILVCCKRDRIQPPKLISLTANANRGDAQQYGDCGYSVYLTKPIKQSQLYKSLLLVKGLKDENQFLEPAILITKHFVDEFKPDCYKVLVVDENPSNLKMIVSGLARLKVRCDVAAHRDFIASALEQNKYDLALIACTDHDHQDYNLIDGMKKKLPDLKIVLMVEEKSKGETKSALQDLANDIIVKPLGNDSLIAMLRRNLNR